MSNTYAVELGCEISNPQKQNIGLDCNRICHTKRVLLYTCVGCTLREDSMRNKLKELDQAKRIFMKAGY